MENFEPKPQADTIDQPAPLKTQFRGMREYSTWAIDAYLNDETESLDYTTNTQTRDEEPEPIELPVNGNIYHIDTNDGHYY